MTRAAAAAASAAAASAAAVSAAAGAPAAYDAIAERYDRLAPENAILAYMRRRSLDAVRRAMPREGRLLEVGCGTGEEAAALAAERPGTRVVAVDPSPGMVARARARGVDASVLAARDLADLDGGLDAKLDGDRSAPYDGAWSSFALSYEPDLAPVADGLARLLRPGAPLVVTLRNPWCASEWWALPLRASGRYRHKVGDARVAVRHWSVAQARACFEASGFRLERAEALPLLLPPPRYGRVAFWAKGLAPWDARLAGLPALRALGDHSLLVLRRS